MEHLALGLVGYAPPIWLDSSDVDLCRNEADAVAMCWNRRRVKYSLRDAAGLMGMPASHLSNIISGHKYLPNGFRASFMRLCQNYAIRQWEDKELGLLTTRETPEQRRIRELETELAKARAA